MKHQARKRFGQHFLTDQGILSQLIGEIKPLPKDHMVEIGPGLGAMTQWILRFIEHLHVVEIDRDLAQRLRSGPWKNQLTVHEMDVLEFDFSTLPGPLRVVGNLPYNISSPILFGLLPHINHVQDQHFMLQKEVIDRMVAQPGTSDYGRLSVMLQAYYAMDNLMDVPPESFDPPPKVMSAIVRMEPRDAEWRSTIPAAIFSKVVAAAFSQRRKMLRNNWSGLVSPQLAEQAGIQLTSRAEDLACDEYIRVAQLLQQVTPET